jgi:SAM-dependent methyltransferase
VEIRNWQNSIKDIASYPSGVKNVNESIMANAVNAANYDLLALIKSGQNVIEIGCGSDSWLRNNLPKDVSWDGIDVFDTDSRGRKCIATKLGSVHEIPFSNDNFDWVLANQSMEHWFEYGVQMKDALSEIARVLREGGQAHLNFPFYLHGHPFFVQGNLKSILTLIDKDIWNIVDIIAYKDSEEQDYLGWRRCGFPDKYVQRFDKTNSSFVVNLVLEKISSKKDAHPENPDTRDLNIKPHISSFRMALTHGIYVLVWKIFRKLVKGKSGGQ